MSVLGLSTLVTFQGDSCACVTMLKMGTKLQLLMILKI